jgi:hypothetical protein
LCSSRSRKDRKRNWGNWELSELVLRCAARSAREEEEKCAVLRTWT